MTDRSNSVRQVHEFLDGVDWDLVEDAADLGSTALAFIRKHPWMLMAAGSALSGLGLWQTLANRKRGKSNKRLPWARHDANPVDLMSP